MDLERSHCRNYDEKEVEKQEKIPIVTLQKQMTAKISLTSKYNGNTGKKNIYNRWSNIETKFN